MYGEIKQELKKRGEYPIHVAVGEEFTTVLSNREKMYTFNSNEEVSHIKNDIPGNTQVIAIGDRAGYVTKMDGQVYVWGYNDDNFI